MLLEQRAGRLRFWPLAPQRALREIRDRSGGERLPLREVQPRYRRRSQEGLDCAPSKPRPTTLLLPQSSRRALEFESELCGVWSQAGTYSATQAQEHYASELESAQRINLTQGQRIFDSRYPAKRGTCSIFAASVLVEAVLFLHLLWCGWVLLGWTVTRCRRLLRTLHIASLIYAIVIEIVPWPPCPLTVAETWLAAREGIEPAHGPGTNSRCGCVSRPAGVVRRWLCGACLRGNAMRVYAALSSSDRERSMVTENQVREVAVALCGPEPRVLLVE